MQIQHCKLANNRQAKLLSNSSLKIMAFTTRSKTFWTLRSELCQKDVTMLQSDDGDIKNQITGGNNK